MASAIDKIRNLDELMNDFENQSNMLIYCGATDVFGTDIRQIDYVQNLLKDKHHMKVEHFTCDENMDERKERLNGLANQSIQALVAIRCLDEGVNVPSISIAFILASSTNPKEYIQRRGRVLRTAPGKDKATIYDFVTMPYRKNGSATSALISNTQYDYSLVLKELRRMWEFGRLANNKEDIVESVESIAHVFHIKKEEYRGGNGYE